MESWNDGSRLRIGRRGRSADHKGMGSQGTDQARYLGWLLVLCGDHGEGLGFAILTFLRFIPFKSSNLISGECDVLSRAHVWRASCDEAVMSKQMTIIATTTIRFPC